MAEQAWYKEWFNSPYYHKLYFERDEKEAEAFIRKLVEHLQPAACSRMLDIACGRGRHSRTLSSMGFEVTGIDLSVSSIEYAKKFENEKLEFFVHDMRLPFRANYYDYAAMKAKSRHAAPTRQACGNRGNEASGSNSVASSSWFLVRGS